MLLLLAGLLTSTTAVAGDGLSLELQGGTLLHQEGPAAMSGAAALVGGGDSYLSVEGRLAPGGMWIGRAGAGIDSTPPVP